MLEPREIPKLRKQLGVTKAELAGLAGVSQALIAKIESGRIDPSFSKAKALSETLLGLQRKSTKKTKEIMVTDIISVESDQLVRDATELMQNHAISQLPVFERGRLAGSISDKALVRILSENKNPQQIYKKTISSVMEQGFPIIPQETPIEALYSLLAFFQAVIVSEREKIVGILTKADLLRANGLRP